MPDVILPVLDESEALPWVLARMPDGYHPIVVDNGSTDGSGAIARASNVEVIVEPRAGFGSACFAGLSAARDEVVCFMDCDGSLDPGDLASVARLVRSGSRDLVLGARVPEPGAWPAHARAANRLIAWEIRRRTGVPLTDLGPMRAARREALLALDIQDRRFGWPFEMVLRASAAGLSIGEVDVPYRARSGHSKVTGTLKGTLRAFSDLTKVMR